MNFQEKRNKITMLQERANKFNQQEDQLIEQNNLDPLDARKKVISQLTEKGKTDPIKLLPFNDDKDIHGVQKNTSQGYSNTHKVPTSYTEFGQKTKDNFQAVKTMRQSDQLINEHVKQEKELKEQNKQRIAFFKKDHVQLLFEGVQIEDSKKSLYGQDHAFTQEFEKDVQNHDLTYHVKKNDINVFTDAFVKHKKTMRK